jgi:hypothetical protein
MRSTHESGYGGGREPWSDWESGGQGEFGPRGYGGSGGFGGGTSTFGGSASQGARSGFGAGQQSGYGGYRGGEYPGGLQGERSQGFPQQQWGGGFGISYAGRGPKGYRRSDERIKEDVSDRLEQHHQIDATEVEVSVVGGTVTLSGTVPDRQMKRLTEDVVEGCPGVREVINQLRIARPGESGQQGTQQTTQQTQAERSSSASTSKR